MHASAAGLKAYGCVMAADGIEDLRRACGGHGYLMSSGIAPLEADFKGARARQTSALSHHCFRPAHTPERALDTTVPTLHAPCGGVYLVPRLADCGVLMCPALVAMHG